MKQPSEEDTEALINEVLDAQLQPSVTDEAYNERARNTPREARSPFSTSGPDKIARRVALELVGKSGSEKEAIVAQALTQVQAPLVAIVSALLGEPTHGPIYGCRCDSCTRAIENAAALTGTGEKR